MSPLQLPPPSYLQACSHRHAQSLMEMLWRGDSPDAAEMRAKGTPLPEPLPEELSSGSGYARLLPHVLLPIYLPAGGSNYELTSLTLAPALRHSPSVSLLPLIFAAHSSLAAPSPLYLVNTCTQAKQRRSPIRPTLSCSYRWSSTRCSCVPLRPSTPQAPLLLTRQMEPSLATSLTSSLVAIPKRQRAWRSRCLMRSTPPCHATRAGLLSKKHLRRCLTSSDPPVESLALCAHLWL